MKKSTEKPFSRAYQVGVVVRDMDRAVEFYESLGIGPFVEGPSSVATDRKIYGKPADVKVRGTIAQMGQIEFELLQPVAGESIQKEFLDNKGEGVIHICSRVDNIDREVAKLAEKGFSVISSGRLSDGGQFAYIDTREVGGVILELFQPGAAYK
jgi:methylmalonyl-CoA/ethylmalonyl-CoA epimerase